MTAYATADEVEAFVSAAVWATVVEADVPRLCARASELLDDIVRRPFEVDSGTGLPADEDIATVMSNACCAQIEFWLEVGEEHDIDGLASTQVSVTGYSGPRAREVAPRAARILRQEGMLSTSPIDTTWGEFSQAAR